MRLAGGRAERLRLFETFRLHPAARAEARDEDFLYFLRGNPLKSLDSEK